MAFATEFYATGAGLVSIFAFIIWKIVISIPALRQKLAEKWWLLIEIIVYCVWGGLICILFMIFISNKTQAALESISFCVYLAAGYFSMLFVLKFLQNKERKKNYLFLRTGQLIPMLKFERKNRQDGTMVPSNREYTYFFTVALIFTVWTLLAGMLLDADHRYIGLMLTGLAVAIVYMYSYSQAMEARTFDLSSAGQIKRDQYDKL